MSQGAGDQVPKLEIAMEYLMVEDLPTKRESPRPAHSRPPLAILSPDPHFDPDLDENVDRLRACARTGTVSSHRSSSFADVDESEPSAERSPWREAELSWSPGWQGGDQN